MPRLRYQSGTMKSHKKINPFPHVGQTSQGHDIKPPDTALLSALSQKEWLKNRRKKMPGNTSDSVLLHPDRA